MMRRFLIGSILLVACSSEPSAKSGRDAADEAAPKADAAALEAGGQASEQPTQAGAPGGASTASQSQPAVTTPPKRDRIRIHNSCAKPMKFHIERVNDSDLDSSITNSNEIEERGSDGDEIRLIGENHTVLDKITIAPSMKLVDVAQSCSKLEGKQ